MGRSVGTIDASLLAAASMPARAPFSKGPFVGVLPQAPTRGTFMATIGAHAADGGPSARVRPAQAFALKPSSRLRTSPSFSPYSHSMVAGGLPEMS